MSDHSDAVLIDQGKLLAKLCLHGLRGDSGSIDDVDESALVGQQIGVDPDILLLLWNNWLMQDGFLSLILDTRALVGRPKIKDSLPN